MFELLKITLMGLAYKKNINDPRETPATWIAEELLQNGAKVRVFDPFVPTLKTNTGFLNSEKCWKTHYARQIVQYF
jgi:UDP-N-acetyl-D-glucosamine dehydrogenase